MGKRKKPTEKSKSKHSVFDHERYPRRTHMEATINDALLGYSQLTKSVNKLRKTIKDSFDPFRKNLKGDTYWMDIKELNEC